MSDILLKMLSFLFNWEIVTLQDIYGETYLTLVKHDLYGKWCNVYWLLKVGHVRLLSDGTCKGSSSYICRWEPYKKVN